MKDYYDAGEIDVKFCPMDGMWANVLTKPLLGQKFRDMHAFLKNCRQDYDDYTEQNNFMNPQDVASSQECVGERAKNARDKGRQDKSPCCVSWADKTQALSCEQTRQGSVLCLANTSTKGIQKLDHVDKPHGQHSYKKQHHVEKIYALVDKDMQGTRMRATK